MHKLPKTLGKYSRIQADILDALKGSSSQQPIAFVRLAVSERLTAYPEHDIERALDELYQANQVNWCKVTQYPKKGEPVESIVWWIVGKLDIPDCYKNLNGEHVRRGMAL